MVYETVVGMEVHVELHTRSKMFCRCPADHFQVPPNQHVCPVCTAQPGSLPVINSRALELTVMAGMALHCQAHPRSVFARKNYVYPDLPKGYQISQYEAPLCTDGWVEIDTDAGPKRIGVVRVHLEEDTGKLVHSGRSSLVDYNRAGVPLMEIVSDASLRSAEEAYRYLLKIRQVVRHLGASTGDMEKGAMRCEANISVRPAGCTAFGTKVEAKNLNSFRAVRGAIEFEARRQIALLEGGGRVQQITVGWDEELGATREQRSKESSEDYRYFPEPDLLEVVLEPAWLQERRDALPELPDDRARRLAADHGLAGQDIALLVDDRDIADYYDVAVGTAGGDPKLVANWMTGEMFRRLKEDGVPMGQVKVAPHALVELIRLVQDGTINQTVAREVFGVLWRDGGTPTAVVQARGLGQISDTDALDGVVAAVLAANPDAAEKVRGGNQKPIQFLMGQVMKQTRGKANPQTVVALLRQQLALDA